MSLYDLGWVLEALTFAGIAMLAWGVLQMRKRGGA